MAPQTSIPLSANILGVIGTVLWCIQLVPQIWHNYRSKKTEGLPGLMIFLFALCSVPFGVYAIVQNFNTPVQIQPQIFGTLSLVCWAQVLIYNNQWRTWTASLAAAGLWVLFGGVEAVLILTLRGPYASGVNWPVILIGVLAAIALAAGLLPPYYEMWKRRGRVVGINFMFLTVDMLGGCFSLMALVCQDTFDVLGGVQFLVCIILEIGIFTSHGVWYLRTRHLHKQAKLAGVDFDDLPEARVYQDKAAILFDDDEYVISEPMACHTRYLPSILPQVESEKNNPRDSLEEFGRSVETSFFNSHHQHASHTLGMPGGIGRPSQVHVSVSVRI